MQAKLIFAKSKTGEYDIEGHLKFMVYSQRSQQYILLVGL